MSQSQLSSMVADHANLSSSWTGHPPPSPRAVNSSLPHRSPQLAALNSPSLPSVFASSGPEAEDWARSVAFTASDLLQDVPLIDIAADEAVEKACQIMLEKEISCLAVYELRKTGKKNYVGLFDYADLNAFLLLAVQVNSSRPHRDDDRVKEIIAKAKEGGDASVGLACDLSQKNPLVTLPPNASLISILTAFSRGTHRVLIADEESDIVHGLIEDRHLVRWFSDHARDDSPLISTYSSMLCDLPYIANPRPVISLSSDGTIIDAMDLMSTEGVSSIAVVDVSTGNLLSAVSVTDIGKIVAPSQDKKIIYAPLTHLVTRIKEPYGSTDGEERYPVFSVLATNTLDYTMQKLLATNAHRVFITEEPFMSSAPALGLSGNLRGVVSMVDVLCVFARLANIPDVDPSSMSKHRRANSTASSNGSSTTSSSRSRTSSAVHNLNLVAPINIPTQMGSPRRVLGGESHSRRGSTSFVLGSSGPDPLSLSPMIGGGIGMPQIGGDKQPRRSTSISRGDVSLSSSHAKK